MPAARKKPAPKPRKPPPDPRQHLGIPIDDTIPTKSAIGRPSNYHPAFCDKAIQLGKQGYSPCQIACQFETIPETLSKWAERWPAFGIAIARAKVEEQAWWEERGRKGLEDRHFNAHLWVKVMQCRFRRDYADRVEMTGADGGPILFQTVYEDAPKTIDVTPTATHVATQNSSDPAE